MNRQTTGYKDRTKKAIHVGDTVRCDHPIFTNPKEFIVEWDNATKRYNIPSDPQLLDHCEIVQIDS